MFAAIAEKLSAQRDVVAGLADLRKKLAERVRKLEGDQKGQWRIVGFEDLVADHEQPDVFAIDGRQSYLDYSPSAECMEEDGTLLGGSMGLDGDADDKCKTSSDMEYGWGTDKGRRQSCGRSWSRFGWKARWGRDDGEAAWDTDYGWGADERQRHCCRRPWNRCGWKAGITAGMCPFLMLEYGNDGDREHLKVWIAGPKFASCSGLRIVLDEYKRQLGHRIYTRAEFLERLKRERGPFRCSPDQLSHQLGKGEVRFPLVGETVQAVPGKLKQGYGDAVCQVLHTLFKEVLRRLNFEFLAPSYPDEGLADEADVDSDAEIHSVGEDEMPGDGEEDDLMYQEDAPKPPPEEEHDHQVLQANVDPKEWLLEVERVSAKLKVVMPNDSKEWRTHLQQTKSYKQVIETQFPNSKVQLDKLTAQLSQAMERIKSKEAFINTQFDHRALDYRQQQEELQQVQQQYTELNEVVMNLQIELKNVGEELDLVKNEMDEKSSAATDTTPIVKMKDAFKRLRADTRQLEVRIGVVSHTLMQ
ncbi:ift57, partial [Symbiodinium sp. KB8]